ncbi:MAG TPA: NADH:flavin oxidoreductase [Solirubrobacteraceae bacterium]|nr:NADH:flavin oxidoreductase [Solirubrobacteraceae bacterium]
MTPAQDPGSAYRALLTPLPLKGLTIRNRVMMTAHVGGIAEDGVPKRLYRRYQQERARGGVGLTVIGASTAVTVDAAGGAYVGAVEAIDDAVIPWYRKLADTLHAEGTTVFTQLTHMGRRFGWDGGRWLAPVAPSLIREPAFRAFPKEMEDWDFTRILDGFAAAARRAKDGGLDGLEVSAAHGHLLDQFWSQESNRRTDRYGGSLANRTRFAVEVLAAIRDAVGADYVVGVRMSADQLLSDGLSHRDCLEIGRILVDTGNVDFLDVIVGNAETFAGHMTTFPDMAEPEAPYLQLAAAMKAHLGVPVFHAQRVTSLERAASAVADGSVDMVGMTRAHLADPHMVRKLLAGRADDIRPCVGANYCIDRVYAGKQAHCIYNAATGRETTMPHRITRSRQRRRIVVIGGGPAGLEAARVSAERGHSVILFEQAESSGGAVTVAARAAGRGGLAAITEWLERQALKKGVDARWGVRATADLVLAEGPDVVIVASGGSPNKGPLARQDLADTCFGVLSGESELRAGPTLVYDENGREGALSCAAHIAAHGGPVEFLTADPAPGAELERTVRPPLMRRCYEAGVRFTADTRLLDVRRGNGQLIAVLGNDYTMTRTERRVAQVVVDYGSAPNDEIYHELKPASTNLGEADLVALVAGRPQQTVRNEAGTFMLFRIGDAVASRNIHAAVYDALRLCVLF